MKDKLSTIISVKTNGNVSAFADAIGVSQQNLSKYVRGVAAVSSVCLVNILKAYPDLSAEWLMRGEGSMYKSDNAYNINNTQARDGNNIASGENASATMTQTQDPAMTTLIKNMMEQQSQELQAARKRIDELTDKLLNK